MLIDGQTNVAQVLGCAQDTPSEALRKTLEELVGKGYVSALNHSASDALDPGDFFTSGVAHAAAARSGGASVLSPCVHFPVRSTLEDIDGQ